jgi:polyhydroxyalkanoate synthesis regulator phasin
MQLHKKGALIVTLALVLVLGTGTVAMAATGSLTQIEKKWVNVQELVLKKMVKEGQLTQEQADEQLTQMKEHLQASSEDDVYIRISHGIGKRVGLMGIMTDAWAELTGQDPGDIRTACQEQNTNVWELAKQAGQEDALKQKILALAGEKLDTLVKDGKITDEKKTKILDGMKKKLDDENFPSGFMGGCHGKHD